MSGWGRISFLIGAGVLLGAGCGGRTGALDGEFGDGADGGALSRGGSSAGRSNRGGAGAGGTVRPVGGTASQAGAPLGGYGGTTPYPVGGYGGFGVAGTFAVGGYGGYGFGGTFGVAGYGGFGVAGSAPLGGTGVGGFSVGGQGPQACGTCLLQSCTAPLVQCLQDFGCLSIFNCMQTTGCQAFQCYSQRYCKDTIDQWGGPKGEPMSELLSTFSCAVTAGCPCN